MNNDIQILIKSSTQFGPLERKSWQSSCNIAYKFNKASKIFAKYERPGRKNYFCFLVVDGEIKASYSGFSFEFLDRKGFLSTDTFSLSSRATSLLGNHLYKYLADNGYDFVCGWPNKNIANIRYRYLNWRYLGHKRVYIAYPKLFPSAPQQYKLGPFAREDNQFISREPNKWLKIIDNSTKVSSESYRRFNLSLGNSNYRFAHVPLANQSKLFGYKLLSDVQHEMVLEVVHELFRIADFSWIDVP